MRIGDKIKMSGERCRYTVQAFDDRFIIATRPHFATYYYTLIDRLHKIRGPFGLIFGLPLGDVNNPEGARETLEYMQKRGGYETWGVSHRNRLPLTGDEIAQIERGRDAES